MRGGRWQGNSLLVLNNCCTLKASYTGNTARRLKDLQSGSDFPGSCCFLGEWGGHLEPQRRVGGGAG